MKRHFAIIRTGLLILALISSISCLTRNQRLENVDGLVRQQLFEEAHAELEKDKKKIYKGKKDEVLYLLDAGLLNFYSRDIAASRKKLEAANELMEEYRAKSISEGIGAVLINDNVLSYAGTSYESVFSNLMLSLGYLAQNNFDGGFVELRRTQNKLNRLQNDYNIRLEQYRNAENAALSLDNKKIPFADSAFARLLSFWIYRADRDFSNLEVAARKYNEAVISQPGLYKALKLPLFDLASVLKQNVSAPRVHLVALTGRVPFKIEHNYAFNSVPNGIIITSKREIVQDPNSDYSPVKSKSLEVVNEGVVIPVPGMISGIGLVIGLPLLARVSSAVARIEVLVDGAPSGELRLTESLERIALATFDVESKIIYARTIARAIGKMLLGIGTQVGMEAGGLEGWGALVGDIFQIANNISEKADTRSVRYYPAHIWTGDIVLEREGAHTLTLIYHASDGSVLAEKTHNIEVSNKTGTMSLVTDVLLR